ncbi:MAG: 4Fe-4S binding protein [Paramuribaculum sp.]|nr:4Fe-4S binding protein [Paramuribaculum sp.]
MNKALRIGRIIVSIVVFIIITTALTSASLMIPGVSLWLERIQFLPAVMLFALGIFVSWLIITLIFGRIYCSTVCPLGTVMDSSSHLFHRRRYVYRPPRSSIRYGILVIVLACLMGAYFALPSLIDPYSIYLRFCTDCLQPLWQWITGRPPAVDPDMDWWDKAILRAVTGSLIGALISLVTLAIVCIVAARHGRLLCNTVCPVGTTLGFISRFSIFQIDIDTDKCIQCYRCADVCKSECIDLVDHVVDGSRCVNCFNCINVCPNDAIHYTTNRKQLAIPMMQQIKGLARTPQTTLEITQSKLNKTDETISGSSPNHIETRNR